MGNIHEKIITKGVKMVEYLCPVCKHNEVEYEDKKPRVVVITESDDIIENKMKYVSICSNCQNVYCYKADVETIIKTKEKENETNRSNEGSEKPENKG